MSNAKLIDHALSGAILRGDVPFALSLVPRATPAGLTAALADVVECAASIDDVGGSKRWMPLRLITDALLHADAGMPPVREECAQTAARNMEAFGLYLPAASVVGWTWCVQDGDDPSWPSLPASCAKHRPNGLRDELVASWAARRAADDPHASWAMRLLAYLGEVA